MRRSPEDAIPLVTASKIGDWVETAAREALDERSAKVALIESDSAVHVLRVPTPAAGSPAGSLQSRRLAAAAPGLAGGPVAELADDTMPTEMSSGTASVPARGSLAGVEAGGRRWRAWLAGAGVGLAAIVVSLAVSLRPARVRTHSQGGSGSVLSARAPAASSAPSQEPSTSAPTPQVAAAATAASTAPSGAASATTLAPPQPPVPASPASAATGMPSAAHAPAPAAAPAVPRRAPAPAVGGCNPPWSYDHRGVRVFKPECL